MFCGNCGTNNQEGTAFCESCGAPLVAEAQPEVTPAAPKKNLMPIIIAAAAAVVVIILLIVLLSGGHGYGDPEDAALAWVEGQCDFDTGDMLSAVYPEMADAIEEDLEEDCEEAEEYLEEMEDEADVSLSFGEFEAKEVKGSEFDKAMIKLYEEWFNSEYDTDVEFTDIKEIKVTYEIEADGKSEDESETVTVVEIDGDWYVWPSEYIDADISGLGDFDFDYDYDYDFDY